MYSKKINTLFSALQIFMFGLFFLCLTVKLFAQPIDPLSLHFKKDYQLRNFYNSTVELSKLNLSQDISHTKIHLNSPGCKLKKEGELLLISNKSETVQESYIDLGKLYNYAAIDLTIQSQTSKSSNAAVQLSFYKNKDNRFVLT